MATNLRGRLRGHGAGGLYCGRRDDYWIRIYRIDRGYERIEDKLRALGANIET